MQNLPSCPQCTLENTYLDGDNYICPDCTYEWPATATAEADEGSKVIKDSNGNVLVDGDAVILIKDLKVKGSSTVLKKRHQSQKHPLGRWRSRGGLQDGRRQLHAQGGVFEEGVIGIH